MTQNQIRYQEFLEAQRHNAATENEVLRHNVIAEEQTASSLGIAARQAAAANTSAGAAYTSANAAYLNALTNQANAELARDKYQTESYVRGIELGYEDRKIKVEEQKLNSGSWSDRVGTFIRGVGTALGFLTAK